MGTAAAAREAFDNNAGTPVNDTYNFRTSIADNATGLDAADTLDFYGDITTGTALPDTTTATTYTGISFKNKNLTLCKFNNGSSAISAATTKANFLNCSFAGATLPIALNYSSFAGCNMTGATLTGANLQGADFSNATGLLALTFPVTGEATNNSLNITLPSFSAIVKETNGGNPNRRLTYTVPTPTTTNIDSSLAGGALTATGSPSASIPAGAITINTTTSAISNANIGGNVGRLIPLNVLKLARAVGAVVNIQ